MSWRIFSREGRAVLFLGAVCLMTVAATAAQPKTKFYPVIYPLPKNILPEEGTIELWVRPDMDVSVRPASFYHFFMVRISYGKKTWGEQGALSIFCDKSGSAVVTATLKRPEGDVRFRNLPRVLGKKIVWKQGEWHHLAFTWKGTEMAIYLDGKLMSRAKASEPIPATDQGYWVVGYGYSRIAVDHFVVSSIARTAEQIKQRTLAAPDRDEHTLLLDPMEDLGRSNGRAFKLNAAVCKTVEGKFGKAVQLYQ